MHNIKLTNIIIIFIYTLVVLWFSSVLLGYNTRFLKIIIIGIAILPFIFTNIIRSRDYWLIIGLGATMYISKIPLPLLDAISVGYMVNALILALLFSELAIKKFTIPNIFKTVPNRCMAFFMIVVTARFVIDRPGAGSMGGTGGLSAALPTLLAGWCFFSTYLLAKEFEINKKQMKVLSIIALFGLADVIYKNIMIFIPRGFINMFPYPAVWFLSFIGITNVIDQLSNRKNISLDIKLIAATCCVIILSFMSLNRAPAIYAPIAIFIIYFCYKYLNKYILLFFLGIVAVISTATLYPTIIPKPAMRTMSLFIYQTDDPIYQELGETGWQSDWRLTLAKIAWQDIKKHPIAGKGFAFSFEELYFNARIASKGDNARFGGLLTSGGYHNSFLFSAVKVGLPATIAFIIALLNIYYRFIKFSRKLEHSELKRLCVTLSAVFICILGKMLTNGGALDLFSSSVILATMQGIMINNTKTKVEDIKQ